MARGRTRKNSKSSRTRKNSRTRRTYKNRRLMKGGLDIYKVNKPKWVKKTPMESIQTMQTMQELPKLNVTNPEPINQPIVSSPDSSPMPSPKTTVIDVSFAVPKKQQNKKQENTSRGANTGTRFNLFR